MDGLKQRIVGALVLVSLAVIFVPMMFDEPHSERQTTTIEIPEEPPFPEVEMPDEAPQEAPQYRIEESQQDAKASPAAESTDTGVETEAQTQPAPEPKPEQSQPAAEPEPEPEPAPEQTQPAANEEASSAEFTRSLEGAWVVQLGSFGSEENATRLQQKAREKGYSTHLQEITRGDAQLTRVFSGPFAEKAEAEKAKQALDKAFGLNSLVTSGGK